MDPTLPEQATIEQSDEWLDVEDIEPDPLAVDHAATRRDNLTGTDAEGDVS
jgi:hypothetical protein